MAKTAAKNAAAIQRLLEERGQVQRWLDRLSMAADAAPESVRDRVKSDYERRLRDILSELEGYAQELQSSLQRIQTVRNGLAKQEAEAAERVSEAELRHAVGEYEESQWRQIHAGLMGDLVKVREELKQSDEELARVQEVVSLIEAPPALEEAPPQPPAEPRKPAAARPAEPAATPRRPQRDAFDELAFLRSVTEDESHGPAPSRASGTMRAIGDDRAPPIERAVKEEIVERPEEPAPRGSKATKSLKCGECGTLNLPTEWYCEQCGAELAAL